MAGKYNKHKQDGSHLGFPVRMILATVDLQVTSILPMNFESIALCNVKCPKLQRAITHEEFFRIYSKVNQVIFSSIQIYSPGFKALASIAFEILC